MGWFDYVKRGTVETLKVLQKERGWTGRGVPLEKAAKVEPQLVRALGEISLQLSEGEQSQAAQLQAAMTYHSQRMRLLGRIESYVASMGQQIAVEEKVTNQLLALDKFAKANGDLWRRDWKRTLEHIQAIQKNRQTSNDVAIVQQAIRQQERVLTEAEAMIQMASKSAVADIMGTQKDSAKKQQAELLATLGRLRVRKAELQKARSENKYPTKIGDDISQLWEEIKKVTEEPVHLPALDVLQETADVKEFKATLERELQALEMVLFRVNKQVSALESIGIEVIPKSKQRNLNRGVGFLVRATE